LDYNNLGRNINALYALLEEKKISTFSNDEKEGDDEEI